MNRRRCQPLLFLLHLCAICWVVSALPTAHSATIRRGDILVADPDFVHAAWVGDGVDISTMQPALWKVDAMSGARELITSKTRGAGPTLLSTSGVVIDSAGRITLGDPYSSSLRRVDPATGDRTFFAGAGPEFISVGGLALDHDDSIVVADHLRNSVWRVHPLTGDRTLISGPDRGLGRQLENFHGVVLDKAGDVWTLLQDELGHAGLVRIDAASGDRTIVSGFGEGSGDELFGFHALGVIDATSALLARSNTFIRVDLATGDRTSITTTGPWVNKIFALAPETDGSLVGIDELQGAVYRFDLEAGVHTLVSGFTPEWGPRLWMPQGIAVAVPEPERVWLLSVAGVALAAASRQGGTNS